MPTLHTNWFAMSTTTIRELRTLHRALAKPTLDVAALHAAASAAHNAPAALFTQADALLAAAHAHAQRHAHPFAAHSNDELLAAHALLSLAATPFSFDPQRLPDTSSSDANR